MNSSLFLSNFFLDFLLISIPILFAIKGKKKISDAIGLGRISLKDFLKYAVLSFIGLIAAAFFFGIAIDFLGANDTAKVSDQMAGFLAISPLFVVYLFTVKIFAEEVFFRAFLVQKTNVLFSSVLFGLMHFGYGSIAEMIGAFFLGLILAITYSKSKSILPLIASHICYNMVVLLAIIG